MGRNKGCTKTGGRAKGTPNKSTRAFRDYLDDAGISLPEKIFELLHRVSEEKQLEVLVKLMSFTYPKFKAIELVGVDLPAQNFVEWAKKAAEEYEKRKALESDSSTP